MALVKPRRAALAATTAIEVADGVLIESRAVTRLAARAAREVRGVISLEPTLAGFVADIGRRLRDLSAGRGASDPVDGVRVECHRPGSVVVDVALSVGGRPARDVAVDVARHTRQTLENQLGVRTESVRVTVVDIALLPVQGAPLSDVGW